MRDGETHTSGVSTWYTPTRILLVAGTLFVGVTLYSVNPAEHALIPKCPFKLLTGLDCPGCGFQRAAHALLHGHVREAIGYNLFLPLALPYLLALVAERTLLRGNIQRRWQDALESKPVVTLYVVAYAAWFVIRNLLHI